jgi:hypothetical protein
VLLNVIVFEVKRGKRYSKSFCKFIYLKNYCTKSSSKRIKRKEKHNDICYVLSFNIFLNTSTNNSYNFKCNKRRKKLNKLIFVFIVYFIFLFCIHTKNASFLRKIFFLASTCHSKINCILSVTTSPEVIRLGV